MNHKEADMRDWKSQGIITAVVVGLLLLAAATVQAQGTEQRGTIRGGVYKDVNSDGRCVNTGIAGEDPVPGVEIVFVSSDKATVVTLTTGDNGTFGLAAAGQSIWEVTARPDATKWIVTSKNPLYVPVLPEPGLVQTDVNFCVSQGTNAIIVLPASGGAATASWPIGVVMTAVAGMSVFAAGLGLEWRRRKAA